MDQIISCATSTRSYSDAAESSSCRVDLKAWRLGLSGPRLYQNVYIQGKLLESHTFVQIAESSSCSSSCRTNLQA